MKNSHLRRKAIHILDAGSPQRMSAFIVKW